MPATGGKTPARIRKRLYQFLNTYSRPFNYASGPPRHSVASDRRDQLKQNNINLLMKKIEAFTIAPSRLEALKSELSGIELEGLIVEARQFDPRGGRPAVFRGTEYTVDLLPKIKVEVTVADGLADMAIGIVREAAQSGERGNGKVFVSTVEQPYSVSEPRRNEKALSV